MEANPEIVYIKAMVNAVAETAEEYFARKPNLELKYKVEFFERLMRYCSQQRNYFIRKQVDNEMIQKTEDRP